MKKDYKKFSRYGLIGFAIFVSFLPIFNPLQIFTVFKIILLIPFKNLPKEVYSEDPVINDIDDRSLTEIGQWPWSRAN